MSREDVFDLLEKAKESLRAADLLLNDGFCDFAASRAYYAMFYATEALLLTKDLSFSKHSAVIAAFGKEFVKSGLLPQRLRDYLISGFEMRQLGDYGSPGSVARERVQVLIEQAREFVESIEEYLGSEGYL